MRTWTWTLRGLFFMAVALLLWALFWPMPVMSQEISGPYEYQDGTGIVGFAVGPIKSGRVYFLPCMSAEPVSVDASLLKKTNNGCRSEPYPINLSTSSQSIDGTPAKILIGDHKGIDRGHGSAIYIGKDENGWGRWLTAKHVAVENMTSLRTRRLAFFGVEVEWLCPACDVAVVKTRPQSVVPLIPAPVSCRPFRLGEEVHYTGAPATSSHLPRITIWGRVASEETAERPSGSRVYIVDITVNRGASGSGVLDAVGRVIGIVSGADFSGGGPFGPGVHTGFTYIAPLDPEFCRYERGRTKGSSVGGV